jgi:hypothetical protein
VLEHVRHPERLLEDVRKVLVPRGVLIASVPNLGHWYARGRIAAGMFDYDQRGILDQGHVRFFMRRGFARRLHNAGFSILRQEATGLPLEVLSRGQSGLHRLIRQIDHLAVAWRPTLFGYQFVFQCESPAQPRVVESLPGDRSE